MAFLDPVSQIADANDEAYVPHYDEQSWDWDSDEDDD